MTRASAMDPTPADELVDYEEDENPIVENKEKAGEGMARGNYVAIHASGFQDFFLKPELLRAIGDAGFEHPSEVQHETIPHAITGVDILCQAKSGMGKTAVFVLAVLQQLPSEEKEPGVICLGVVHTRELAYQLSNEFMRFGKYIKGLRTEVIFGGVAISKNIAMLRDPSRVPHILIGTPGRLMALIREGTLDTSKLTHFVLDECDKCLEKLDMRKDVVNIFTKTPKKKQTMFFSATMNKDIRDVCKRFLQSPVEIFIDDDSKLTLHGLSQYYIHLNENEKNRRLRDLLDQLEFNQVIIFVKSVPRANALDKILQECNFPCMCIHAGLDQDERLTRYRDFKAFTRRILVSTDLLGRGIDVERINIVINYDMPDSSDTYLHRVGRAGRFGTKGLAITFSASKEDEATLESVQTRFELKMREMPETLDASQYINH